MITKLDVKSAAMARGLSDLSIRNLFILPTIAFLIAGRSTVQSVSEALLASDEYFAMARAAAIA